ncbi:MAG: DNA-binding protein [Nostoc sp. ChiQUE02]|uniref:DNA-binding protein n=1 Tax=Nostoc sp. ChiQUE02 TaxID=3075377 RepID=UPI002AD53618|nr:DNA-binding protein [Nostoc sp. ChiQUE02]MDZ8233887.1 DNA-binding protein [Nostoc sp. ChiQUE02]
MTAQDKTPRPQMNLDLSPELYETLNNLAQQINGDNGDVLLKAIALLEVALEAKQKGKYIWIVDDKQNLETEIIGI